MSISLRKHASRLIAAALAVSAMASVSAAALEQPVAVLSSNLNASVGTVLTSDEINTAEQALSKAKAEAEAQKKAKAEAEAQKKAEAAAQAQAQAAATAKKDAYNKLLNGFLLHLPSGYRSDQEQCQIARQLQADLLLPVRCLQRRSRCENRFGYYPDRGPHDRSGLLCHSAGQPCLYRRLRRIHRRGYRRSHQEQQDRCSGFFSQPCLRSGCQVRQYLSARLSYHRNQRAMHLCIALFVFPPCAQHCRKVAEPRSPNPARFIYTVLSLSLA